MSRTARKSSSKESQTVFWMPRRSSGISEPLCQKDTPKAIREWLTLSPGDSPASRSVSRESKPERTTHGTSGLKPLRQLALLDQSMSFSKMYQGSSTPDPLLAYVGGLIDGEGCISIQKTSGKKKACYYLEITIGMSLKAAPLLQAIKKSFGGTLCKGRVKSKNWDGSLKWRIGGEKAMEFLVKVQPYIILKASQTSIAIELEMMRQNAPTLPNGTKDWSKIRDSAEQLKQRIHRLNQKGPDVQDVVGRWITPQTNLFGTSDSFSGPWPKHGMMQDGSLWELTMSGLPIAEKGCGLWPSPTCMDIVDRKGMRPSRAATNRKTGYLSEMVKVNSPERPKYCNAGEGQLNPDWVCWLMGWPIGWESLEPMKKVLWLDWSVDPADMEKPESYPTPMSAKKGKTGNTIQEWGNNRFRREPFKNGTGPIPRIARGIPDRVNRLKALGNGQVPLVAATAFHILSGGLT